MTGRLTRMAVPVALAMLIVLAGFPGTGVAIESEGDDIEPCEYCIEDPDEPVESYTFGGVVTEEYAGSNMAAGTQTRKQWLQAKKAFHEARLEIQAIKKGDESPVEDVPTFFQDDEEEDGED